MKHILDGSVLANLGEASIEICHNPNIFGGYSQITFPRKTLRENFLSKYCGKRKGGGGGEEEGVNPFKAKIKYIKRGSSFFTLGYSGVANFGK
jgi:hypothetical protein